MDYESESMEILQKALLLRHLPIDGPKGELISRLRLWDRDKAAQRSLLDDIDGSKRSKTIHTDSEGKLRDSRNIYNASASEIELERAKMEGEYRASIARLNVKGDELERTNAINEQAIEEEKLQKLKELGGIVIREQNRVIEVLIPCLHRRQGLKGNDSALDRPSPSTAQMLLDASKTNSLQSTCSQTPTTSTTPSVNIKNGWLLEGAPAHLSIDAASNKRKLSASNTEIPSSEGKRCRSTQSSAFLPSPCASNHEESSPELIISTIRNYEAYLFIPAAQIPVKSGSITLLGQKVERFKPAAVRADASGHYVIFGSSKRDSENAHSCANELRGKMFRGFRLDMKVFYGTERSS